MATQFSPLYTERFDTLVKEAYVAEACLMNAVRVQPLIEATSFTFKRMGVALATQFAQAEVVTDSGTKTYNSQANMSEWKDSDIIGEEELKKTSVDALLARYAQKQGGSVKRLLDQLILAPWNASTLSLTSGVELNLIKVYLGDGTQPANPNSYISAEKKPFSAAAFMKMKFSLMRNGITNNGDLYIGMTAAQYASLLNDDKVTNVLYVDEKALVTGYQGTWLGVNIIVIDGRPETGLLPVTFNTTNDGTRIYMWHKESTGLATLETIESKLWQEPTRFDAWMSWTKTSAGGAIIDPNGIVACVADNTL